MDSVTATRDLKALVDSSLDEMHGTRRWAVYRMIEQRTLEQQVFIHLDDLNLNLRERLAIKWIEEKGFITSKQYDFFLRRLILRKQLRVT